MKMTLQKLSLISLLVGALALFSCSNDKSQSSADKAARQSISKNSDKRDLPNYRYVDVDSVLVRYDLSKSYSEEMQRMQSNLENTLRAKENQLQQMGANFQKKLQNNGYSTQQEYENDQKTFANAQSQAQQEAMKLQENAAKKADEMQKAVTDSIESFIKEYNKTAGYDAIFMKAATLYIDPALDITDEVVKGLNERYNKSKK